MKIKSLIASLALVSLAHADQTIEFPKEKPLVAVDFPEKWEAKLDDDGLMVTPAEEDSVIIEMSELKAGIDEPEEALEEAKETFEDFKNVKYDEAQKGESNGLGLTIVNGTGEDEHGKAFLNLLLIAKPGAKHFLLLSCITSQEGSDKFGPNVAKVIQTLRAE